MYPDVFYKMFVEPSYIGSSGINLYQMSLDLKKKPTLLVIL